MTSLTEAHRLAQARLGAETVAILAATWPLIDPADVKASGRAWLSVAAPAVQAQRQRSAQMAAAYLRAHRTLELGEPFDPVLADSAPSRQVATSLLVTGVYGLLANIRRGLTPERSASIAQGAAAGAAMRLALNGGRETITATVKADPRGRGYRRVTSGKACSWCSMLAGRGAVYGEASVNFDAHDHCSCSGEPIWS